ncbi:MAG: LCP family protein [Acidimicrobiales bacterium]|nr:LCP family protein [Acidimicrobiales bacterium]
MTDDVPGPSSPDADDRAKRLAALLSVDIERTTSPTKQPHVPVAMPVPASTATTSDPEASPDPPSELASTAGSGPAPADADRGGVGAVAWVLLVLLVGTGVALGYAGLRIVRNSTEGQVLAPIDDPTEPGFEAVVDPTPTLVVMHDNDGLLDALVVLTLPDPDAGGGGVILVPERTVMDLPLFETNPIEAAYDLGDPVFAADSTGLLLGVAMQESTVVDADRWADLVTPVAPIRIDNPNELSVDGEVRFPPGEIELAPADVGPYLEARVEGESDLARLFRHEVFWNAWLDAIAADGTDGAVPGELDTGIGRFVRAIARGAREVQTLPVQDATPGRYGEEPAFVPKFDQMRTLADRLVPLPASPGQGIRGRVRVLNGTPDIAQAASVASRLPPAGVSVTVVGNAGSFDVAKTTVEYFGAEFRGQAEEIAEILGVGEAVEDARPSDSVDITVTLGADYG